MRVFSEEGMDIFLIQQTHEGLKTNKQDPTKKEAGSEFMLTAMHGSMQSEEVRLPA